MILRNSIRLSLRSLATFQNGIPTPVTRTISHRNYASKPSPNPITRVIPALPSSPSSNTSPSPNPSETSTASATGTILPPPRPYRSRTAVKVAEAPSEQPSSTTPPQAELPEPEPPRVKDPARGAAAAQEFVKTGHLPAAYRWAGYKQTALLVSAVLLIVLTPVLYGRVVQGKERKRLVLPADADVAVKVEEGKTGLEGTRDKEGLLAGQIGEGDGVQMQRAGRESQLTMGEDESVESSRYREG